jgi:hypothetical protein
VLSRTISQIVHSAMRGEKGVDMRTWPLASDEETLTARYRPTLTAKVGVV